MTNQEFMLTVDDCVVKCKKILNRKRKEYSFDNDRFSNFKSAAGLQSCSPKQALYGMLAKHLVAINDLIDEDAGGEIVSKKDWEAKIYDAINYLWLLQGMLKEEGAI